MRRANVIVLSLILVVGAALVFSFAGNARDAAGRTRCVDNLRQLSLTLQSYNDYYMRLPSGTIPHPHLPPVERFSWNVAIFPFIEGGVALKLDLEKGWKAPQNRPVILRYSKIGEEHVLDSLPLFICPGSPSQDLQDSVGITHYVGLAGIGEDATTLPGSEEREGRLRLGIFGYDRWTRLSDVYDGRSYTIALVETALDNGPWTAGGPPTVRGINQGMALYLGAGRQFGGIHQGGTMAAFADGAAMVLSNRTSPQVFEALATIAGGEKVNASDYAY